MASALWRSSTSVPDTPTFKVLLNPAISANGDGTGEETGALTGASGWLCGVVLGVEVAETTVAVVTVVVSVEELELLLEDPELAGAGPADPPPPPLLPEQANPSTPTPIVEPAEAGKISSEYVPSQLKVTALVLSKMALFEERSVTRCEPDRVNSNPPPCTDIESNDDPASNVTEPLPFDVWIVISSETVAAYASKAKLDKKRSDNKNPIIFLGIAHKFR
ncbi:MAG: hypothetical protein A3C84_00125 [Candidatus Ryanbacteria bacterium RIFCSPHIGHO2_02_FULL_48_12]|nr:MAG: hypothetical protein A3C84_00125 [Candidatus Ryanbacteria bacterium RIFCSPHIGHO2_02_FULL_48_12]